MTWLHVPGFPCAQGSEGSNSGSRSPSVPAIPASVTSKGKPFPPRSWSKGWSTGSWLTLLSGLTLKPSTAVAGVDAWISSLRVSLASRLAPPESVKGSTMSAGSGTTSLESFAKWHRDSYSWKTSLALFAEDYHPFSGRWPRSGSMRSGICFELPTSEHRTSVSGGSFWPTPTAGDSKSAGSRNLKGSKANAGVSLTDMIRFGNSNTPRYGSHPDAEQDQKSTPKVLNPRFVEHLMGIPPGYSVPIAFERSEMESFQRWRLLHSERSQLVSGA